jgi:predicted short-subunit dehydrogenase-like oxidoreductase (DUF2520 family)
MPEQMFVLPEGETELQVHFAPLTIARLDERLRLRGRETLAEQVARGSGQVIVQQAELEDLIAATEQLLEGNPIDEFEREELFELRHAIARLLGWTTAAKSRPDAT